MDLRQLGYFVAVVEEGQFTRAATRLAVAQPAVTSQLRQLERDSASRCSCVIAEARR
jgi:DNA-binding transcriptional LysR family regulator